MLEARAAAWWQGPEALWRWRDIAPVARKLVEDAGDPESLMTVGYFLYSRHIHPVCEHDDATLWSGSSATAPMKARGGVRARPRSTCSSARGSRSRTGVRARRPKAGCSG